jgi:hypothetical protein
MSEVSGNTCLYYTFRTCTLMLVGVGLGNIGAGVAVCVQADDFAWYNGGYIFLGFYLVLLAILGHTTRSALGGLTFYLVCLAVGFAGETGFTVAIIVYTDYENILGVAYANVIRYTMLAASLLVLIAIVVGLFYRSSLKDAQFYKVNENLINPQIHQEPVPRPSIKREEMEKKYNIGRRNSKDIF